MLVMPCRWRYSPASSDVRGSVIASLATTHFREWIASRYRGQLSQVENVAGDDPAATAVELTDGTQREFVAVEEPDSDPRDVERLRAHRHGPFERAGQMFGGLDTGPRECESTRLEATERFG